MFIKNERYYADWRTPDGKRHRKAFATAIGAKRHETKQRQLAPPAAQSAAAVQSSQRPFASERKRERSDALRRRSSSVTSVKVTSSLQSRPKLTLASPAGTHTQGGSGKSSARSLRSARRITVAASQESSRQSHARKGRPKTRHVGVLPVQTSLCVGSSHVRSTSDCGTKLLLV
jgi:hypothetical protein